MADPGMGNRAWLLLVYGKERQHAGNAGYEDVPDHMYRYDSFVPNHRQLKEGDAVLLQSVERVLGYARIENIQVTRGSKVHHRCPQCGTTGIKQRRLKTPSFRCNRKHEFAVARVESVECDQYVAEFGSSFVKELSRIAPRALRVAIGGRNEQLAIRPLNIASLQGRSLARVAASLKELLKAPHLSADDANEDSGPEFTPSLEDTRELVMRQIRERRGQASFRRTLRKRYDDRCMVTGCTLADLLESAHIRPYRGPRDNHAENGLLLRSDIHTLFDLDLLGIDPEAMAVRLHPAVARVDYSGLEGARLQFGRKGPSRKALVARWEAFTKRLARK